MVVKFNHACMHAKLLQLCLTLCKSVNCSCQALLPMKILQARIPEWVAIPPANSTVLINKF